jgi:hypothetical protein
MWRDLAAKSGGVLRFAPDDVRAALMAELAAASRRKADTAALDRFFLETFAACGEDLDLLPTPK